MDGIIPLYKPRGMTSHDCVARLRKILHMKRIGHSGTLDPDVDGVLPICIGDATKVVTRLMASGKTYQGEITLGFSTTTEDLSGETIAEKSVVTPISVAVIDECLTSFIGVSNQTPPMYSAVKVNGRKLYEYARAGETVERPIREIHIQRFERRDEMSYDAGNQLQKIPFVVDCSKGTYIRTLAVDVGNKLGYPAVMSDLTRLASGGFTLAQTITFEDIEKNVDNDQFDNWLFPIDYVFNDLPSFELADDQWRLVQNGGFIPVIEFDTTAPEITLRREGIIKAVYERKDNNYRPDKMFLTNEGR